MNTENVTVHQRSSPVKINRVTICPCCDLVIGLPYLKHKHRAVCPRCHHVLTSFRQHNQLNQLLLSLSGLFMLVLSCLFPIIGMQVKGNTSIVGLLQIPYMLTEGNYIALAILFYLFILIFPLCCFVFGVILSIDVFWLRPLWPFALRWLTRVQEWCMGEIFLTGILVSFVKLMAYGDITVGLSFIPYCVFAFIQILLLKQLDPYFQWLRIAPQPNFSLHLIVGEKALYQNAKLCSCCHTILPCHVEQCPRCHHIEHPRRYLSVQATVALLLTALIFYIPANILPVMSTQFLGDVIPSTIFSGVIIMWDSGSYFVGLVIFAASIIIPCLKIIGLFWLCYLAKYKTIITDEWDCQRSQFVYHIISLVGRWSMIDIFVISILTALVHMGILMSIIPSVGAILFSVVVIVTMIAALVFDPRLIWDNFDKQSHDS